jgi:SAM-dependent methyltransferase
MSLQVVAEKWSTLEPDLERIFFGFPPLRFYQIKLAFGPEFAKRYCNNRKWAEDILFDHYLSALKPRRILSLGCGFGHLERILLPKLPEATCLAIDLAPGAIEAAQARAAAAGLSDRLEYRIDDLNKWSFPKDSFDLVLAGGAIHHLSNLEGIADGIRDTLRASGLFYANEFVGPSYWDHPRRHLELINAVAYLLPPELHDRRAAFFRHRYVRLNRIADLLSNTWRRLRTLPDPQQHPEWSTAKQKLASWLRLLPGVGRKRPDEYFLFGIEHDSAKHELMRTDPSESVRSADILPIFRARFPGLEVHPYGGAMIVHGLDWIFYSHFDTANPMHRQQLELLCALEEHYLATGEIKPEVAILIGRKS